MAKIASVDIVKGIVGVLWPFVIVALIWGMAMYVTHEDNNCVASGGHQEFSANHWSGEVCSLGKPHETEKSVSN